MTLHKIVSMSIFFGLVGYLSIHFGGEIRPSVERERRSACIPLDPVARDEMAPDFTLPDHANRQISLASLRGRVVLVNFWATWCPPCREEMPGMDALAKSMRSNDFVMLSVSVDEDWKTVREFFPQGTAMTVLLDTSKEIPKRYGTEKFPETFLIDREGRLRYHIVNKRDWSSPAARACIESLL